MNTSLKTILFVTLVSVLNLTFGQTIDVQNSFIKFTASNMGTEAKGEFRKFAGSITFDPNDLSKSNFNISIDVNSINTKNKMRDEHLREEEFFGVKNHPNITFSSTKVIKIEGQYHITGTLTMKGITKEITFPFAYDNGSFNGGFSISRNEFKIGNSEAGSKSDLVNIQIHCTVKPNE